MLPNIDVEGLIHRLQDHALADAPGIISDAQVDAAIALLDRVLPDLHHIDLGTAGGQPISLRVAETASGDDMSTK